MKFIVTYLLFISKITILFSQCNSTNQIVINELTFETPTNAVINVKNTTGEVFRLQQKKIGDVFVDIGLEIKNLGRYSFTTNNSNSACYRLISNAIGCLPSNEVCLPTWDLNSIPNKNTINIIPSNNEELIILKNSIQLIKYSNYNFPFIFEDNDIICRETAEYRIVINTGATKITTFKWAIKALAGNCAIEDIITPSIFTPNNDGINDSFSLIGNQKDFYSIIIFDRWNNTVFETPNIDKQWNGNINNGSVPVAEGLYYFVLEKLNKNADIVTEKGEILLQR